MTCVTEWFENGERPVRVGVYETWVNGWLGYSYWNLIWGNQAMTASDAVSVWDKLGGSYAEQSKKWRGLVEQSFTVC